VSIDQVISSDPEVQGGAVVFAGTRVPLKNFIDYLEAGDSIEVFLEHCPSVTRAQPWLHSSSQVAGHCWS